MASSTLTEYYKLSQFQPNDTANWLDDYNPDMQKIDTALHALSEQTAPLQDQIDALDARLDTEEAQSQLQGEQIVSLQTSINRNNDRVDNMQTKVNSLNGEVDTLQAQVEVLQNGEPSQQQAIERLQQDVADIKTVNDAQATAIATNAEGVGDNAENIATIRGQLNDFGQLAKTVWTPGSNITGNLTMLTTWHNVRCLQTGYGALEWHDMSAVDKITIDGNEWDVLATAEGKVFNTKWPEGSEEQPNTTVTHIQQGWLDDLGTYKPIHYYWHYDVLSNTTYLLYDLMGDTVQTGAVTSDNVMFIED